MCLIILSTYLWCSN